MKTKHAPAARKRRKKILKSAKGYWGRRSKNYRRAKETVRRAFVYAYRDRRTKKREIRALWITRINAAARMRGFTYRDFMPALKKKKILLSRDILAHIAIQEPLVFDKLIEIAKS